MESTLGKARLVVNEMTGTVWTSTGLRPGTERAMWNNVEDHEGFVLAGCPGVCDDQSSQAPIPIPVGNASYMECFLQKPKSSESYLSMHQQAHRQSRQRPSYSGSASHREASIFFGCLGRI